MPKGEAMPRRMFRAADWRAFYVEIGIVVIGVIIALGADQAIRSLHQRQQVADAKVDFQTELTESLFAAKERVKWEICIDKQLSAFDELVRLPGAVAVKGGLDLSVRPWSSTIWESGVSAGNVSLMAADERINYALAYAMVNHLREWNMREFELYGELSTLKQSAVMTEVSRDRLGSSLAKLRELNRLMVLGSQQLIESLKLMGMRFTPEDEKVLDKQYSACEVPRRAT